MGSLPTDIRPAEFFGLLADDLRWQMLAALSRSDERVGDLADRLDRPINLVSYHLGKLRRMKVVRERRSDADSRDVYYGLDVDSLREIYLRVGQALHPGLTALAQEASAKDGAAGLASKQSRRILFLCTENSGRSQMAEGILRHFSRGQIEVVSAGSRPTSVHPLAIHVLAEHGIDISQHRSKSLEEFSGEHFDYVITVCDRIREECPTFPGGPESIHWSFADPAAVEGDEERRYLAFRVAATELMTMIRYLIITIEQKKKDTA